MTASSAKKYIQVPVHMAYIIFHLNSDTQTGVTSQIKKILQFCL